MVRCFSSLLTLPIDLIRRRAPVCVTRGLDPRVHPLRKRLFSKMMDCRVKPGNDSCGSSWTQYAFVTLAMLLWGLVPAAWATGPLGPEIRFFSRSGQDPVDDLAFFRGQLGILRPTFTDNRLYAAYRIMLGGRFSEAQARQLLARCCGAPETPSDAETSWNELRKRVAGVPPAKDPRYGAYRRRPEDMQLFDVSCLPNAYRNSAATLRARIAQHGANSPLLRDWVIGQDAVLLNCYENSPLPEELPPNARWIMPARDSCSRRSAATPPRRGRKQRAISSHAAQSTRRSRTRRQSSSPMRSRRSTRSQRIRSSPTIAPRRRNWPRCSPSRPARRSGRGSWNARYSLPSYRPRLPSTCATFCCWSGPARATRISARGSTTSTF